MTLTSTMYQCVYFLSTTSSKRVLVEFRSRLRRMARTLSVKCPWQLPDFSQNWNLSTNSSNNLKTKFREKSIQRFSSCYTRRDMFKVTCAFPQLCAANATQNSCHSSVRLRGLQQVYNNRIGWRADIVIWRGGPEGARGRERRKVDTARNVKLNFVEENIYRVKRNRTLQTIHFYFCKDTKNVINNVLPTTADPESPPPNPHPLQYLQRTMVPQFVLETLRTKHQFWRMQRTFIQRMWVSALHIVLFLLLMYPLKWTVTMLGPQ